LAVGLLGVLGLTAASCVAIVGADEEWQSAAQILCACDELSFLGASCVPLIEERLRGALEPTRAKWMTEAHKQGCFTDCKNARACFQTAPTCGTDICDSEDECCPGLSCQSTDTGTKECL
jgi:hypothetical protein